MFVKIYYSRPRRVGIRCDIRVYITCDDVHRTIAHRKEFLNISLVKKLYRNIYISQKSKLRIHDKKIILLLIIYV